MNAPETNNKRRPLRSGFTTGACAAAAAKAAALALVTGTSPACVEIGFPDALRRGFAVHQLGCASGSATASVIKDAGDDPDVTNGAEIIAQVSFAPLAAVSDAIRLGPVFLGRGDGVGRVTKPGLAVAVGEPAINPVPRRMICEALAEVIPDKNIHVVISVRDGERLAEKTLNKRLGIVGGLSILGTTGIVRPISAEAWTATVEAALSVAKEAGLAEVALATGRTSEKAGQSLLDLPEEAFVMMGDYLEFSLAAARSFGFVRLHFCGMWAKVIKAALRIPQTHVRNGALEVAAAAALLARLGAEDRLAAMLEKANTAREILTILQEHGRDDLVLAVCEQARAYAAEVFGGETRLYLVNHRSEVLYRV
ncbi:MAG: cobalt-precorrin-5B (C(1))-methyltransferase [Desulfobulbaceae bacterium]|jgi:cobalt-precorrin-5B (C1)-methyltransferase|nr:cobalt-precorrin-5B (C(1))-methyltransferase [Desulfobulbaceae bacterium]